MMECRHCVCGRPGTYSIPKWGWADRGKDRLQKGYSTHLSCRNPDIQYTFVFQKPYAGHKN